MTTDTLVAVTLDFETYYDQLYSLSNKQLSMQSYILDKRFEPMIVSIKVEDGPTDVYSGRQIAPALAAIDWSKVRLIGQNTSFDGAILGWHYGHYAAQYVDIMAMANASGLSSLARGASLSAMTKYLIAQGHPVPSKGTAAAVMKGRRLSSLSPTELADYELYCASDSDITRYIYNLLLPQLPADELKWHDLILRMYIQPSLHIDAEIVENELGRVLEQRRNLTSSLTHICGGDVKKALGSNARFAELLMQYGELPLKKITKAGREEYAFAKTDEYMSELLDSDMPMIATLAEARLGVKSSIDETRCMRFLNLAKDNILAMPYKVSGALSHRLSGQGGFNLQNLPSGRKAGQNKALRQSIKPTKGNVIVVGDSGQIEVRTLAYSANQQDLLQLFANGGDPYSDLAGVLYNKDPLLIAKLAKDESTIEYLQRSVGKVGILSLGYGAGAVSTQRIAKVQYGIDISLEEVTNLVDTYRAKNYCVPAQWKIVTEALKHMALQGGNGSMLGPHGDLFNYDAKYNVAGAHIPAIQLPDGMWIVLDGLHAVFDSSRGWTSTSFKYSDRKSYSKAALDIWGGSATGIMNQALAFALVKWQGIKIYEETGLRPILNSHDEYALSVPIDQAEVSSELLQAYMTMCPPWLKGLPLKCSTGIAGCYGDAK